MGPPNGSVVVGKLAGFGGSEARALAAFAASAFFRSLHAFRISLNSAKLANSRQLSGGQFSKERVLTSRSRFGTMFLHGFVRIEMV